MSPLQSWSLIIAIASVIVYLVYKQPTSEDEMRNRQNRLENKTVIDINRLRNTNSGNPRFEFVFSDGTTAVTEPNAMWVYSITPRVMIGIEFVFEFDYKHNITDILPVVTIKGDN